MHLVKALRDKLINHPTFWIITLALSPMTTIVWLNERDNTLWLIASGATLAAGLAGLINFLAWRRSLDDQPEGTTPHTGPLD